MILIEETIEGQINASLAHIFVGVMKADGTVSMKEEILMDELIEDFSEYLSGNMDKVSDSVTSMIVDPDYAQWKSEEHLKQSLEYMQVLVDEGANYKTYVNEIVEVVDKFLARDAASDQEKLFLQSVKQELTSHFLS